MAANVAFAVLIMNKILEICESIRRELLELSHKIHSAPELGFEEHKAVALQKEVLERYGFEFKCPFCELDTAYIARKKGNPNSCKIAFLAEYDALKGIGHACGHNIIASSAVGAGIALSLLSDESVGDIFVIGTPAEEGGGGKVYIVERGGFDGIDFAMMMHPGTQNLYGRGGIAATHFDVEFFGKASHAVEPHKGINALTSMIEFFNSINALRQTWKKGHVLTGIITNGGKAPNVIPDYTSASFVPRGARKEDLEEILEDMERAAKSAAALTGADYSCKSGVIYAERYPNIVMGECFRDNLAKLGETVEFADESVPLGSSDIGNVSRVLPTIHEYLWIADNSTTSHSDKFREAAVSKRGDDVVVLAAEGMAMTAYELFTNSELRDRAKEEFKRNVLDKINRGRECK